VTYDPKEFPIGENCEVFALRLVAVRAAIEDRTSPERFVPMSK
jgi:hypothetical protein